MPLTRKGNKIMGAMQQQYGSRKAKKVFYASKNKGTISGVDEMSIQEKIIKRLEEREEPISDTVNRWKSKRTYRQASEVQGTDSGKKNISPSKKTHVDQKTERQAPPTPKLTQSKYNTHQEKKVKQDQNKKQVISRLSVKKAPAHSSKGTTPGLKPKLEGTLQDRILNRLEETRASKQTQAAAARARAKDAEDRREREERILSGKKQADDKKEAVRQANIINKRK
jgi:hypothetical protein